MPMEPRAARDERIRRERARWIARLDLASIVFAALLLVGIVAERVNVAIAVAACSVSVGCLIASSYLGLVQSIDDDE